MGIWVQKISGVTVAMVALLFWGCSTVKVDKIPNTADPTAEIQSLESDYQGAGKEDVGVLSPNYYAQAGDELREAREARDAGASTEVILDHIAKGRANLNRALDVARVSRATLPEVLEARAKAIDADAKEEARRDFDAADRSLKKAMRRVEKGDVASAQSQTGQLQRRYELIELKGIKETNLGPAWNDLERAKREGASRWAPRTLKQAQHDVAVANAYIDQHRDDRAGIEEKSLEARNAARHLVDVNRQAKVYVRQDGESLVLNKEAEDRRLAEANAQATAATAQAKRRAAELSGAKGTVEELQAENTRLAANEERYRAIRKMFPESQADVFKDGDNIVIRLKGMSFPSNRAAIPSSSYRLMSKVVDVLDQYDSGKLIIQGHTDASGSGKHNLQLSEKRAQSVADYLAAHGVDTSRIEVEGRGDSQPLASNKTRDGREKNRRVDIVIQPSQEALGH